MRQHITRTFISHFYVYSFPLLIINLERGARRIIWHCQLDIAIEIEYCLRWMYTCCIHHHLLIYLVLALQYGLCIAHCQENCPLTAAYPPGTMNVSMIAASPNQDTDYAVEAIKACFLPLHHLRQSTCLPAAFDFASSQNSASGQSSNVPRYSKNQACCGRRFKA